MKTVFAALLALTVFAGINQQAQAVDLKKYDFIDPRNVVPDRPLRQALTYFELNKGKFSNKNYIVIVDFTQPATADRMYIINMTTGAVERHMTSAGKGSDKNGDGRADKFSNSPGSNATSLGFYRTAEMYKGKHGQSLRLDGLSSTNSNARARAVVVHAANYVDEETNHAGRSQGCFAVDPDDLKSITGKIKGGAMIYAWAGGN